MGKHSIDITGHKFNKLTALRLSDRKYKNGAKIWHCRCDCGREIEVGYSDIIRGETKSCGCYRKEMVSLPVSEGNFRRLYRNYANGAKKRHIEFDISLDDFRNLTIQNCYYCGITPQQIINDNHNTGHYMYNGIDRRNNKLGYTLSNSVACCKVCNFSKRTMSEEEFLKWISSVYEYRHLGV